MHAILSDGALLLAAILAEPDEDTPRLVYADWLQENGQAERAEFIRVQCKLAATDPSQWEYGDAKREYDLWVLLSQHWINSCRPLVVVHLGERQTKLSLSGVVRRGFVGEVTCTASDWLTHADAILASHPVREVTLTTVPESAGNINLWSLWKKMVRGEPWYSNRWKGIAFTLPR